MNQDFLRERLKVWDTPNLNFQSHADSSLAESRKLPSYISGYVDGEGSFNISFSPRPKLLVGWETRPSFSVSQHKKRSYVLTLIKMYFGCGNIREDRRYGIHVFETRSLKDIVEKILPHFEQYPLLSEKQKDVLYYKKICQLMMDGKHLEKDGFKTILSLSRQINTSFENRKYSVDEILGSLER